TSIKASVPSSPNFSLNGLGIVITVIFSGYHKNKIFAIRPEHLILCYCSHFTIAVCYAFNGGSGISLFSIHIIFTSNNKTNYS
ncbi:MAG: hypothetical protein H7844_12440, partial [Nitrospirae bacterium YQR-1]